MNFFRAISNLFRFDRTNWKALALSFFAAAVFWIFNALNKTYSTNLRFPIVFEYDQARFIPVEPLPGTLTLNVTGNGWELFRKSLGYKVPSIAYPLERPAETRRIIASSLSPIAAGLISPMQINYVVTDTLRLHFEPRISRKFKLLANVEEVSFKSNFGRTGSVVVQPDSVTLEGPTSLVENLADTIWLKIHASRVNASYRESVEIQIPGSQLISRNPPVADVMFEVGPVEEVSRLIKLVAPKEPWGTELDRDSVQAVFLVPVSESTNFLNAEMHMQLEIDYSTLRKGELKSFMPMLTGVPEYARVLRVDSVKVKRY